jgi:endonuclease-8
MPEGDTIHRTAATLRRALVSQTVTRFDTTLPAIAAVHHRTPVTGRFIRAVRALGKHLLVVFGHEGDTPVSLETRPGDLVLHTHMGMTGSWHLYRPGQPWRIPARRAVIVLHTARLVAPCFAAPVAELLTAAELARHPRLSELGPDAAGAEFDAREAMARLRRAPDIEIGVALLDQRGVAGVGNVYKSEVLFVQKVSPFTRVGDLSDDVLLGLVAESRRLLRVNLRGGPRRTVPGLDRRERHWVYGRSGRPCRVCGSPVRMRRQGAAARSTYFCPRCQAP